MLVPFSLSPYLVLRSSLPDVGDTYAIIRVCYRPLLADRCETHPRAPTSTWVGSSGPKAGYVSMRSVKSVSVKRYIRQHRYTKEKKEKLTTELEKNNFYNNKELRTGNHYITCIGRKRDESANLYVIQRYGHNVRVSVIINQYQMRLRKIYVIIFVLRHHFYTTVGKTSLYNFFRRCTRPVLL